VGAHQYFDSGLRMRAFKSTRCCFRRCPASSMASSTASSSRPMRCDGRWRVAFWLVLKKVSPRCTHTCAALPGPERLYACTHAHRCIHTFFGTYPCTHIHMCVGMRHLPSHVGCCLLGLFMYGPDRAIRLPYLGNGSVLSRMALGRRPQPWAPLCIGLWPHLPMHISCTCTCPVRDAITYTQCACVWPRPSDAAMMARRGVFPCRGFDALSVP